MFPEISDFLLENYFISIYGITLVLSIIRYRRYFDTVLKYFPIIIAYTLFNEILGGMIKYFDEFQVVFIDKYSYYNVILFNLYSLIFFLFFYYVYWNSIQNISHKNIVKIGAVIFLSIYILSLFFQNPMLMHLYYAYTIGAIVLILCVLFYFKKIFSEKEKPYKHHQNLLFWVSLGLLVFYVFDPALMIIGLKNDYIYIKYNLHTLLYILIVAMYTFFIIGFLLGKRRAFR
ncbi:hypothetical protein [Croceitalea rosinachiae]|uniref:Histidine kinase N-terminal 7TM region domain-containing protein n=1 Tax=Croceitalea rosinachiae TaxID=3075596 RepID=A0ABU3AGT1_9FLAO|nr:hypothetical protein [Croceitalea sp. F388]MDT0608101.1 hypothetical protein [Croceitalea sp. F388]